MYVYIPSSQLIRPVDKPKEDILNPAEQTKIDK